jgi:acetyl esterase
LSAIHPDVAALIALGRAAGSLPFEAMSPPEARRAYANRRLLLQLPPDTVAECRNLTIEGPGGPLRLRLYRGAGTGADEILPCLLYLHGGGWVLGDLDSHDGICCRFANEARCCVVAVDYRLAPEHPFPAALDDAAASLCWLHQEATSLRIDLARIAVGGDSAGGNLAAVLALMGRDGTVPASVFQVLLYPALDMTMSSASYAETTDGMTITPATMRYFIDHYVPHPDDRNDWRASPLQAASLGGAPPAFLLTCGHDPLCDEGRLYASRLEQEDVPVTALHLSDQTHGMLTLSKMIEAFQPTLAYAAATLIDGWRTAPSRTVVARRV